LIAYKLRLPLSLSIGL